MSETTPDQKPVQYDLAWVKSASPEKIEAAREAGRLNDLLGITTTEDGAA